MYEIYINNTSLVLTDIATAKEKFLPSTPKQLVMRYSQNRSDLFLYIDSLEKNSKFDRIVLYHKSLKKLKEDFFSIYKIVDAAGGLVANDKGEHLLIHRRGFWDLPKGKLEQGETNEQAAIREVKEETGIENLQLGDFLLTTFHTYMNRKNVRCIKHSFWYKMTTTDTDLTPQTEEDIEQAVWTNVRSFLKNHEKETYSNILKVLKFI